MKRAAIYTRYSSDRQNERSCADQEALCRAWAEKNGLTVVNAFADEAVSGASTHNRFGLASLMRATDGGDIDVVICEALDRLSRDQADLASLKKRLAFRDIAIMTVQDGEVGAMHIGLKGLMGELYLADLAQKTRRGQRARVTAGGLGGGRSYGYNPLPGKPGEVEVNESEAVTVRRIFAAYAAGEPPRRIAAALNAEGIKGPRGGKWNASTINGSRQRANGILSNRLYVGEIVWNRQRFIKDPDTGKRVSRLNPESEWVKSGVPQLAIVDPELFARVAAIKAGKGSAHAYKARRPRHVFSGLIKCGCCGAGYTVYGRDRHGKDRLGCSGRRERGDCDNTRTLTRRSVEQRVLAALDEHLKAPELIAEYVRTYIAERKRIAASASRDEGNLRRKQSEIQRSIANIVDHIAAGTVSAALSARLGKLESDLAEIERELSQLSQQSPVVALHPGIAETYRIAVSDLQTHMAQRDQAGREALFEKVRDLVQSIRVYPGREGEAPVIEVEGTIAALLDPQRCGVSMVAGAGFEPATFRL